MTDLRTRIVDAAADLLSESGRDGVSTRAVSAAAGVQAPAIYRQFGDMRALLHAAAREVLARYVREKKTLKPTKDPLEELRRGWDMHIAFGLANPAAYTLMYADSESHSPPEARAGYVVLEEKIARLAATGRLRVSVPHAAQMIHAAGCGVVLSLINTPPDERDRQLSDSVRDAVFAALTVSTTLKTPPGSARIAAHAVALRTALSEARTALSTGERLLLSEWLDRLSRPRHDVASHR